MEVLIATIVGAAVLWLILTALNAPGQRDDPGVTVIMAGGSVVLLGVARVVYVLRSLLAQAVARDREAGAMAAELDSVI